MTVSPTILTIAAPSLRLGAAGSSTSVGASASGFAALIGDLTASGVAPARMSGGSALPLDRQAMADGGTALPPATTLPVPAPAANALAAMTSPGSIPAPFAPPIHPDVPSAATGTADTVTMPPPRPTVSTAPQTPPMPVQPDSGLPAPDPIVDGTEAPEGMPASSTVSDGIEPAPAPPPASIGVTAAPSRDRKPGGRALRADEVGPPSFTGPNARPTPAATDDTAAAAADDDAPEPAGDTGKAAETPSPALPIVTPGLRWTPAPPPPADPALATGPTDAVPRHTDRGSGEAAPVTAGAPPPVAMPSVVAGQPSATATATTAPPSALPIVDGAASVRSEPTNDTVAPTPAPPSIDRTVSQPADLRLLSSIVSPNAPGATPAPISTPPPPPASRVEAAVAPAIAQPLSPLTLPIVAGTAAPAAPAAPPIVAGTTAPAARLFAAGTTAPVAQPLVAGATTPAAPAIAQPTPPLTPPIVTGTTAPAAQLFAAAMQAADRDERLAARRPPGSIDAAQTLSGLAAAAAATPVAGAGNQPPLDLNAHGWPAQMIERIETLRDAADAGSTRIRVAPDALGHIDVSLHARDDGAVAVTLAARHDATQVLLADARPELARLGEARGLRFTDGGGGTEARGGGASPQAFTPGGGNRRPRPAVPTDASDAIADPAERRVA